MRLRRARLRSRQTSAVSSDAVAHQSAGIVTFAETCWLQAWLPSPPPKENRHNPLPLCVPKTIAVTAGAVESTSIGSSRLTLLKHVPSSRLETARLSQTLWPPLV